MFCYFGDCGSGALLLAILGVSITIISNVSCVVRIITFDSCVILIIIKILIITLDEPIQPGRFAAATEGIRGSKENTSIRVHKTGAKGPWKSPSLALLHGSELE